MTDLDLDRLGDLWRQRPTAVEMEALQRSAEAVRRRARKFQVLEIGVALAVAATVIALVLTNPETDTLIVGAAAILILLIAQTRNRRLRAEELKGLTGSAEQMLDQSISQARSALKRSRFQLLGLGPSFILGLGVAALVDRGSGTLYARVISDPGQGLVIAGIGIVVVALGALAFGRSMRRTRAELEKLVQVRDSFRSEGRSNPSDRDQP